MKRPSEAITQEEVEQWEAQVEAQRQEVHRQALERAKREAALAGNAKRGFSAGMAPMVSVASTLHGVGAPLGGLFGGGSLYGTAVTAVGGQWAAHGYYEEPVVGLPSEEVDKWCTLLEVEVGDEEG